MVNLLFSAQSGTALGGLFFAFAAVSEYFARRGKKEHGAIYVAGSCVVAALGMMLVTWHGLSHEVGRTGFQRRSRDRRFMASYGTVGVLLSLRWNRKSLSYIGWNCWPRRRFGCFACFAPGGWKWDFALAGCLLWTAAIWFWLAWQHRNAILFTLQQIVLSLSGLLAMLAWLTYQRWIGQTPSIGWSLIILQAFGAVLAAISLAWMIVRIALRDNERFRMLLNPPWLPVDKIATCGLVVFQAAMLVPMTIGGIGHEISSLGHGPVFPEFLRPDGVDIFDAPGSDSRHGFVGPLGKELFGRQFDPRGDRALPSSPDISHPKRRTPRRCDGVLPSFSCSFPRRFGIENN